MCNGDNSSCVDCVGTPNGDAEIDLCGVCDGGNASCLIVMDIDGNTYSTVEIGNQIWTQQNLRVTKFTDGTPIPSDDWSVRSFGEDEATLLAYGNMYNFDAATHSSGLCPEGYRVPTVSDFSVLLSNAQGGALKATGTDLWSSPNTGATNSSGFTAVPAGEIRGHNGALYYTGFYGIYRSTSEAPLAQSRV